MPNRKKNSPEEIAFLNDKFSIDQYLRLSHEQKIEFRLNLKKEIRTLQRRYALVWMAKENVLKKGLQEGNKLAQAIDTLEEWSAVYHYDRLFHVRECISDLKKHLLEEIFGGKQLFYFIDFKVVALDPNFVPFILGRHTRIIEKEN